MRLVRAEMEDFSENCPRTVTLGFNKERDALIGPRVDRVCQAHCGALVDRGLDFILYRITVPAGRSNRILGGPTNLRTNFFVFFDGGK